MSYHINNIFTQSPFSLYEAPLVTRQQSKNCVPLIYEDAGAKEFTEAEKKGKKGITFLKDDSNYVVKAFREGYFFNLTDEQLP